MISAVIHAAEAIADLRRWRDTLRARVRDSFAESAQALLAIVRAKLAGEELQLRTGVLRASIHAEAREDKSGFAARLSGDGSLAYARIQEYGGRIAVPDIAPKNAKALAFVYDR